MAKKSTQTVRKPVTAAPIVKHPPVTEKEEVVKDPFIPSWLYEFKIQAIIVGIIAFVFYFNTTKNEYALDDTIVIVKNEYVHQGFAGIPDILTKDAFDSYYKQFNSSNQLSGGRYRPLSIVSFAVEQQFFGAIKKTDVDTLITYGLSYDMKSPMEKRFLKQMHFRHFVNVLLYTLSVIVLLYFLRYVVFRSNPIIALLAAVIFAIHPLHTEVVANVKSRDEIMSLLFICLTFIYAFKWQETQDKKHMWMSLGFYLLAFLSKEYAITLIALLPLSFYLFNGYSLSKSVKATLPFLGTVLVYGLLRLQVIQEKSAASDNDILNNPYAYASDIEKMATRVSTSLNYYKLLIFPHPLSSDYSYNTIPYSDFSSPMFWVSLVVHAATVWLLISLFKKFGRNVQEINVLGMKFAGKEARNAIAVLCFGTAFFLFHLLLVNNLVFNIGATMGERLIYHSSVGFSIILAWLIYKGMERIKPAAVGRTLMFVLMGALVVLCGFKTIERNNDWTSDDTLFNEDIKKSPNSVLVNANVASSLINKAETEKDEKKKNEDLWKGIEYYNKAVSIHTTFVSGFMNRGVAYLKLNMPDSAKANYDMVYHLYPNYPKMFEIYYNLGVCYYINKEIPKAIGMWQQVLKMQPDYILAQQSINTAVQALNAPQAQVQAQPAQPQQAQQLQQQAQPIQTPQATPAQQKK
jgi:tetratricopeptide (TPR) repeat protein